MSSRTFIRIYSPDELSQEIIGSNELSLDTIKVTRFRKDKRSNEVTKKATTRGSNVSATPSVRGIEEEGSVRKGKDVRCGPTNMHLLLMGRRQSNARTDLARTVESHDGADNLTSSTWVT